MLVRTLRNRRSCLLLVEMKNGAATKTVWQLFKKLKIELPYDPAISLSGTYPKELKGGTQLDIYTAMFIAALF